MNPAPASFLKKRIKQGFLAAKRNSFSAYSPALKGARIKRCKTADEKIHLSPLAPKKGMAVPPAGKVGKSPDFRQNLCITLNWRAMCEND
jgi:hypothetical protein